MDKYERVAKLGEGGQGKVYKVRSKTTGRELVCKMILCVDQETVELATKEAEVMGLLKHPHIIHYEGTFLHQGKAGLFLCLIMEFCSQGDLHSRMREHKQKKQQFAERTAVTYLRQVLGALEFMHKSGFCHRDIKAANILFDDKGAVKVGDFGLSTLMSPMGQQTVVGTPFYFAPEIMLQRKYTTKVDIWNLGIVFLELCTLRQRPANVEVLHSEQAVLDDIHRDVVKQGYSRAFAGIITQALRRRPQDRASATDLLKQVNRIWGPDGEPLAQPAPAISAPVQTRHPTPTRRTATPAGRTGRDATPTGRTGRDATPTGRTGRDATPTGMTPRMREATPLGRGVTPGAADPGQQRGIVHTAHEQPLRAATPTRRTATPPPRGRCAMPASPRPAAPRHLDPRPAQRVVTPRQQQQPLQQQQRASAPQNIPAGLSAAVAHLMNGMTAERALAAAVQEQRRGHESHNSGGHSSSSQGLTSVGSGNTAPSAGTPNAAPAQAQPPQPQLPQGSLPRTGPLSPRGPHGRPPVPTPTPQQQQPQLQQAFQMQGCPSPAAATPRMVLNYGDTPSPGKHRAASPAGRQAATPTTPGRTPAAPAAGGNDEAFQGVVQKLLSLAFSDVRTKARLLACHSRPEVMTLCSSVRDDALLTSALEQWLSLKVTA